VTVRTIASLTGQTPRDVDRTISIPRLAGTQGWTVFQIPSTPGRHLVHRPPLAVAATLPPLRAVPRRSAARALGTGELRVVATVVHGEVGRRRPPGPGTPWRGTGSRASARGCSKQTGGEATVMPCYPMAAYPFMVH